MRQYANTARGRQVAHLKANSSGAIGDLQEEVAKLRSELASAKSEIASLKEKLNQTEWSNKSLQTHVLDKDTVIENLEKQLGASTLRQQQLQVFLLTPPAFRLRPISSNLAFTLNTLSSSPSSPPHHFLDVPRFACSPPADIPSYVDCDGNRANCRTWRLSSPS